MHAVHAHIRQAVQSFLCILHISLLEKTALHFCSFIHLLMLGSPHYLNLGVLIV